MCPTDKFLQSPVRSAFKRLILETPLCQHLLLTMSSTLVTKLTDQECEKGQLTQWPPIPYATPKTEAIMKASRETFKMKTVEGEVKVAVLGDSPGPEEYLQHVNSFLRNLSRKKMDAKMTKSIKAVLLATASMKKFARIPINKTDVATAKRSASLVAA